MLARRQRSMVARGNMGTIVGINIGCRRHLRRRWCRGNGDAGRKGRRVRTQWASKARRALNLFSRFAVGSDASRCSEIYLLRVPFVSSTFFPIEIAII